MKIGPFSLGLPEFNVDETKEPSFGYGFAIVLKPIPSPYITYVSLRSGCDGTFFHRRETNCSSFSQECTVHCPPFVVKRELQYLESFHLKTFDSPSQLLPGVDGGWLSVRIKWSAEKEKHWVLQTPELSCNNHLRRFADHIEMYISAKPGIIQLHFLAMMLGITWSWALLGSNFANLFIHNWVYSD